MSGVAFNVEHGFNQSGHQFAWYLNAAGAVIQTVPLELNYARAFYPTVKTQDIPAVDLIVGKVFSARDPGREDDLPWYQRWMSLKVYTQPFRVVRF